DYVWPPQRERAARALLRSLIIPDRFFAWRQRAYRALTGYDDGRWRFKIDQSIPFPAVIWATFPPASAAALGGDLARSEQVPLVLDFRDLWLSPGGYAPPTPLHRWLHKRLQ